jgi:hypothetical protein
LSLMWTGGSEPWLMGDFWVRDWILHRSVTSKKMVWRRLDDNEMMEWEKSFESPSGGRVARQRV